MIRTIMICLSLVASGAATTTSFAADAPVVASQKLSTSETTIGDLLDNPAAKAILQKHIPQLVSTPQIDMARAMTLKAVQAYASDMISDETLAKIDSDLAKLPTK